MAIENVTNQSVLLIRLIQLLGLVLMSLLIYYLIHIGNRFVEKNRTIDLDYKIVGKVILGIAIAWFLIHIFRTNKVLNEFFISFVIALFLAYIINPAVAFLERKRNIPRWLGVLIIYLVLAAMLVLLIMSVIPRTMEEFSNLITTLPQLLEHWRIEVESLIEPLSETLGEEQVDKITRNLRLNVTDMISGLQNRTISSVGTAFKSLSQVFGKMINVVMVPIITFFIINDRILIKTKVKKLVPDKYKKDAFLLGSEINRVMDDFVRGRVLMAIFVGVSTTIMLLIFRVEFAIVIGIVTMIADIIPYIGPFLGFLPAVVFAFLSSPLKALWVAIIFLFLQWVENNIVAPKVLSTTVGLHPMVIFITIILAGRLFGVLGLILAVPAVAVFQIVVRFAIDKWKEKRKEKELSDAQD